MVAMLVDEQFIQAAAYRHRRLPSALRWEAQSYLNELQDLVAGNQERARLRRRYRGVWKRKCEYCGQRFDGGKPWARFCSPRCRALQYYRRRRDLVEALADVNNPVGRALGNCFSLHHSVAWLALRKLNLKPQERLQVIGKLRGQGSK